MDRGAWRAPVHGVAKLDMTERLSLHFTSLQDERDFHLVKEQLKEYIVSIFFLIPRIFVYFLKVESSANCI